MQLPLRLDAHSGVPLQKQLFDQVVRLIGDGRLKPGMRMPATRQLAKDLSVSRNTIVFAYERLLSEGFLEMRAPAGTFVASRGLDALTPLAPRSPAQGGDDEVAGRAPPLFHGSLHSVQSPYEGTVEFDFWVGRPDPRLFPDQAWRRLTEHNLVAMQQGFGGYGHPAGLWELRRAVADHVGATRGIRCDPTDVVITNGIQEGLNIVARLLVARNTRVAFENPGYLGAANAFASYGARLVPLDIDGEGVDADDLPARCRLLYLTPSHQYPTGALLSPERRDKVLRWAHDGDGYVVEDDYDSDFYYDGTPLPALRGLDTHGRVIYLGTYSKSLAAGLRIGYMIVPAHLRAAATTAKGLLTNGSPWLVQASLAAFLDSGDYGHHLRRLRKIYAGRRDALVDGLMRQFPGSAFSGLQSGMHLLWWLPPGGADGFDLERRLRRYGVGVYSVQSANARVHGAATVRRWSHALVLGYAALDASEIATAVGRITAALHDGAPSGT